MDALNQKTNLNKFKILKRIPKFGPWFRFAVPSSNRGYVLHILIESKRRPRVSFSCCLATLFLGGVHVLLHTVTVLKEVWLLVLLMEWEAQHKSDRRIPCVAF